MQRFPLPTAWQLRAVSNLDQIPPEIAQNSIPAQVPGCVHMDLLREKLIPDPYLAQNENLVQWIGLTDWEYSAQFSVSNAVLAEERVDLVCEGLDTIAAIEVNGVEIGQSENMHVEARFDIKNALRSGDNQITVRFASPVHYARQKRDEIGDLPHASSFLDQNGVCEPFNFIRKNACNFGWDWGPGLITSGIWKAIRLEAWSVARIKSVRPIVRVANEKVAVVDVEVELETVAGATGESALVAILSDGNEPVGSNCVDFAHSNIINHSLSITVSNPKLWCPRGYGEQQIYNLSLTLEHEGGEDEWQNFEVGLREVELDTTPDEIGAAWALKVNGQKIWCKGANWIPDDVFLTRANEPERLQTRLEQAATMGMNMIRVWGGGIYETDEFYAICDQMGLLVWQDFPFACAAYPETDEFKAQIESEARFNIARLAKHPSLVLWNGCNENIWGYFDWDWQRKLNGRAWGAGYYFEMLPALVRELSPATPYWPGSPYSGSMEIHPLADAYGNKHMWDTWNEVNHTHFRRYSPRFASEFGHQAPPTFSTLSRAIPEAELNPFSPSMLLHQKAGEGNKKLHDRLGETFELPSDFGDWLYLTQLMQARAMTTAVEWFRTRSACAGALFWQLNDCWPATSWSAIDGDGKPKPLFYAAKQFFRERLLTIQPDGEHLALWAHNDSDESWFGEGTIRLLTMDGEEKKVDGFKIFIPAREVVRVCQLDGFEATDGHNEFLIAALNGDFGGEDCFWFFDIDKNLNYPEPKFEVKINGNELEFKAQTLIRDIYINADRFGGKAEFGLVTLLPGETWSVGIDGVSPEDLARVDFSGRPIVNCANYFGRK